mgnify:FL=1
MRGKSPVVPIAHWVGEGADAHIVRTSGLRVVLFYTSEGLPSMYVDRPEGQAPSDVTEYEDDLMMLWNRAVLDQVRAGSSL